MPPPARPPIGLQLTRTARSVSRAFDDALAEAGGSLPVWLVLISLKSLSEHLRSRQETGAVLRETGVPVTEFRAPVIVGSGSLSFEIIRYLTERLPVMIC